MPEPPTPTQEDPNPNIIKKNQQENIKNINKHFE